jgi:hypothetical protein
MIDNISIIFTAALKHRKYEKKLKGSAFDAFQQENAPISTLYTGRLHGNITFGPPIE